MVVVQPVSEHRTPTHVIPSTSIIAFPASPRECKVNTRSIGPINDPAQPRMSQALAIPRPPRRAKRTISPALALPSHIRLSPRRLRGMAFPRFFWRGEGLPARLPSMLGSRSSIQGRRCEPLGAANPCGAASLRTPRVCGGVLLTLV